MKKKTLISILLLLLTAVCFLGAVACKKNPDDSKNEHVHAYSAVEISPTCTEKGYTTYTCACGNGYVSDYVDQLGHDLTHHDGKEATLTEVGYKSYDSCSRCDYTTYEEISCVGISFKNISIENGSGSLVLSNATKTFNFTDEITVIGKAKYVVSKDKYGYNTVVTKTIPLAEGDNNIYIIESIDDAVKNIYEITIRRKPIYAVTFIASDGQRIDLQNVEEGFLAKEPKIVLLGYSANFDYDFGKPINSATKINVDLSVTPEMSNFTFTSTATTCEITGLKNEEATSIVIPDYVTSIGSSAFRNCSGLTSITIPDSVTSIGEDAFYGCSKLTSITIPDSVTSIGEDAFYGCSKLTSITIPDSVTSIGDYAFSACPIETAKIPALACSYIKNENLKTVTITSGNTIGYSAFRDCSGLTSITIPDSVTSIGSSAFYGCSGLTSITIPDSVTSIGGYAFGGCSKLTSITIPDSVTSIGGYAFSACPIETAKIPALACSYIKNENLKTVTITSGNTIGYSAFRDCSGLTSITIPDSVTSIGYSAFYGCSGLTSITIPDSVTSIGDCAFIGCSKLTSITIPDSVTSIGGYAFYGCSGLTSITIGNSVTSIGSSAFYMCTSLKKVYFTGTAEEWKNVQIGGDNSPLTSATVYYYSAEAPTTVGSYWHYDSAGKIVEW